MFKEFGLIFLIFIIVVVIFRRMMRKSSVLFGRMCVGIILCTILLNIVYNFRAVYPTFIYEGVPIGDSEENLFVYKKDSEFRWQMLNTISANRLVYLDSAGGMYERYFEIFSDGVDNVELSDAVRNKVAEHTEDFENLGEMFMLLDLDFAFPKWEGGPRPNLYISTRQLKGSDALAAVTYRDEEQSALYVMSESYFKSITEQEEMP